MSRHTTYSIIKREEEKEEEEEEEERRRRVQLRVEKALRKS